PVRDLYLTPRAHPAQRVRSSAPNETFAVLHRVLLAADVSRIHSGHAKLLSADISATNSINLS
ncbi:hypothetical protein, partial [Mesorhizobium huakuii]|uniref:hypothetical protein n=1 Tax=Mesorhizobium huakuii TaxID=28104 RepID=UPI0024E13B35